MHFMKIFVDRNWVGRFRFYINDNQKFSYYADDGFLIFKGDYAKVYNINRKKELNIIRKRSVTNLAESTFLIENIKTAETIEVNCKSYKNGHWVASVGNDDYEIYYHGRLRNHSSKMGCRLASILRKTMVIT